MENILYIASNVVNVSDNLNTVYQKKELFKDNLKAFRDVKLVVLVGNLFHIGTTRDAKQNLRVSHLHIGANSL